MEDEQLEDTELQEPQQPPEETQHNEDDGVLDGHGQEEGGRDADDAQEDEPPEASEGGVQADEDHVQDGDQAGQQDGEWVDLDEHRDQDKQEDAQEDVEEEEEEETYEFTKHQVKNMQLAFSVYDKLRADIIPLARLGDVQRALGLNPTQAQLSAAARWVADSTVRFNQFLIIIGRMLKDPPITESQVLEGFRSLDDNKTGKVPCDRLRSVLTTIGEKFYPNEMAVFLKHADPKKKGEVDYEKFVRRMIDEQAIAPKDRKARRKKRRKKNKKKKKRGRSGSPLST